MVWPSGDGRVVLVSGGSGAIGGAICQRLCELGWKVAIGYVSRDRAQELSRELRHKGGTSTTVALDMSNLEQVRQSIDRLLAEPEPLFGVVLNAGYTRAAEFVDTDEFEWYRSEQINLLGPIAVVERCLPAMEANGAGAIVAVTSEAAKVGDARHATYAAMKAALYAYLEAVNCRSAPAGVRAVAVAPGPIETALLRGNGEEAMAKLTRLVPVRRLGRPQEVAAAVAFLLSDGAAALGGTHLSVGGGITMND